MTNRRFIDGTYLDSFGMLSHIVSGEQFCICDIGLDDIARGEGPKHAAPEFNGYFLWELMPEGEVYWNSAAGAFYRIRHNGPDERVA